MFGTASGYFGRSVRADSRPAQPSIDWLTVMASTAAPFLPGRRVCTEQPARADSSPDVWLLHDRRVRGLSVVF